VNPLLFPPHLVLRALNDLHAIAETARLVNEQAPQAELDGVVADLHAVGEAARQLPDIEEKVATLEAGILERVDGLESRVDGILRLAERIEDGLPAITQVLDRINSLDERIGGIFELVDRLEGHLLPLQQLGTTLDALGDSVRTLAATVEPLQGAAERLGRIADRLPGGTR
jgi:vacuolar-type H+-ATPase subunit I/STV1